MKTDRDLVIEGGYSLPSTLDRATEQIEGRMPVRRTAVQLHVWTTRRCSSMCQRTSCERVNESVQAAHSPGGLSLRIRWEAQAAHSPACALHRREAASRLWCSLRSAGGVGTEEPGRTHRAAHASRLALRPRRAGLHGSARGAPATGCMPLPWVSRASNDGVHALRRL